ncbi:hypothetical protein [Mycobacterium sp. 852002-51971_SCH5477799-a]|uniref:hypothetical protein n=1 Tax=Mycobacterium sp. 852002-51971_SCH5477799-a TaxID=1834106 RepID=UPI0012E902BA|nr:hypothetical protein [Mycobacterium sp. 852002-51971_SCH5477799-a]
MADFDEARARVMRRLRWWPGRSGNIVHDEHSTVNEQFYAGDESGVVGGEELRKFQKAMS